MKSNHLPTPWESIAAIWARNFLQFRKTWMVSLFWILLEPLFVLGALGYGLGSYIPQVKGVSYLEFFFPALLCNSAMLVAFFECTYANFTKLTHMKLYQSALLAPMEPWQILAGEILWGATKSFVSVMGVLLIATLIGAIGSFRILWALPILFLTGLIFSAFGMLITSRVKNYDQIIYPSSGLIIPLSLFSGTYFPLETLPKALQVLAYLSPLTHAVAVTRALQQGEFSGIVVLNVAFLILLLYALIRLSTKFFEQRLID